MTNGEQEAREIEANLLLPEKPKPLFLRIPSGAVIIGAIALGAIYGIGYAYLISGSKKCAPSAGFVGPYEPSFLSCLEINEIGDALGGAFGPLAFLFLAAALLIQAMELAAQRWELDETQAVMREQLDVARQQVAETKASTELMREQAGAIREESRRQREREADQEFEAMKREFAAKCLKRGPTSLVFREKGNRTQIAREVLGLADQPSADFSHCIHVLNVQFQGIETLSRGPMEVEWSGDAGNLVAIEEDLRTLSKKIPDLSSAAKTDARQFGLQELATKLQRLICANAERDGRR